MSIENSVLIRLFIQDSGLKDDLEKNFQSYLDYLVNTLNNLASNPIEQKNFFEEEEIQPRFQVFLALTSRNNCTEFLSTKTCRTI